MIHVYIHYPTRREAEKISRLLLKKRLAGCVSFVKQSDMYWWKGKLVGTQGVVTFVAAPEKNYKKIEKFVAKHHPYQVPCILEMPIKRAYAPYKKWLINATNHDGRKKSKSH